MMKKWPVYICILLSMCLFGRELRAQADDTSSGSGKDMLYLANGSVLKGTLLEYTREQVVWKTVSGATLQFDQAEVTKVVQASADDVPLRAGVIPAPANQFLIQAGLAGGQSGYPGAEIRLGYRRRIAGDRHFLAFSGGLDAYDVDRGIYYVPVLAGYNLHLLKKGWLMPYLQVGAGYGFALKAKNEPWVTNHRGGYIIETTAGMDMRIPGSRMGFNFAVGYKFQKASFFDLRWWDIPSEFDLVYRRLTVRIGFIF